MPLPALLSSTQAALKSYYDANSKVINTLFSNIFRRRKNANDPIIDDEDFKDISQNAFIRAYNGIHNYKEEGRMAGWLGRIFNNCYIDYYNKKKQEKQKALDSTDKNTDSKDRVEFDFTPKLEPSTDNLDSDVDKAVKKLIELRNNRNGMFSCYQIIAYLLNVGTLSDQQTAEILNELSLQALIPPNVKGILSQYLRDVVELELYECIISHIFQARGGYQPYVGAESINNGLVSTWVSRVKNYLEI